MTFTGTKLFPRPCFRCTVPGAPVGKGSVRVGKDFSGAPRAFKDAQTESYMDRVTFFARRAMGAPALMWRGPVTMRIDLFVDRPGRLRLPSSPAQALPCPQKPDVDNCAKGILDALRAAGLYADDKQVVELVIRKRYLPLEAGAAPRVEIEAFEVEA